LENFKIGTFLKTLSFEAKIKFLMKIKNLENLCYPELFIKIKKYKLALLDGAEWRNLKR